ncbi:DEAD/DEAH box helicase family protein, partial [bacterium]|nr:DEAD/DEAH box helicase family protein [bacterium]
KLNLAGWYVVDRDEYISQTTSAVREALTRGNRESDYIFFVDDKAIAVLEAKRADNPLGKDVESQAENYARTPLSWYGLWEDGLIPLVYISNGDKILFKNLISAEKEYSEINNFHTPKKMLRFINRSSEYGALPKLERNSLRDCQYEAELNFEKSIKRGQRKNLVVLATGSGKTYLACLASYRLLNYTSVRRVLFLVDRNNLARQTESEFSQFNMTEDRREMNTLYDIRRLRGEGDLRGDIVISTIQKLFAIMKGETVNNDNEDLEDERTTEDEERDIDTAIDLSGGLKIPPDYFQLIIVDECHRSIYGKWRVVLDYFKDANILGLTATPTPEAHAYFNNNIVENYTYEHSVVDGVNVPARVYRIMTEVTEHGGSLDEGTTVTETVRRTNFATEYTIKQTEDYAPNLLDRSIINCQQIRKVLQAFKKAIYEDLYPERERAWEYVPKTLIFAKNDKHATDVVEAVKDVFKCEFAKGILPEKFVQKITYSSEDSNGLIRDLRNEKDFRIAVTVTLVATGTDVKPLEIVLFMKDVFSEVLYTQMKGRGCRVISEDKLREVTPNADVKDCYYIIDAVGVTEHEKNTSGVNSGLEITGKKMTLEQLLERLSHNELSDDNLALLRDYCAMINQRYENSRFFRDHLEYFIDNFGYSPKDLAYSIQESLEGGQLPPFVSPSESNVVRMSIIEKLINNIPARKKLLELRQGYTITTDEDPDTLINAGFSAETAKSYVDNFEVYINENRDDIEALRSICNAEDVLITHSMLIDLRDRLLAGIVHFSTSQLWKYYKTLDPGSVEELDIKVNAKALTNLVQLVRYAFKKSPKLTSLMSGFNQRFNLYCDQRQRDLTSDQIEVMRQAADFIINDGAISANELNEIDTDLWRRGIRAFGKVPKFNEELIALSKILLKAA